MKAIQKLHKAERQVIVVLSDRDFDEVKLDVNPGTTKRQRAIGYIQSFFFGDIATRTESVLKAVDKLARYVQERRGKSFLAVPLSLTSGYRFPPGHPRLREIYAAHPAEDGTYYPISDFHRANFESKISEAIRLLTALGANTIDANYVKGWDRGFLANLDFEAEGQGIKAGTSVKNSTSSKLLFNAKLEGSDTPSIPRDLAWYEYEPLWRAIGEARINGKLKNFSLSVSYVDDFGINADLSANILSNGFGISSEFTDKVDTTWVLTGAFGPETANS